MLPATYQLPAAIVLLIGGVVACFFGYRLFRIVLAIFGFIVGAFAASSVFGVSDTGPMIVAAVVGGLIGAGLLIAAYFVGVALVGAAGAMYLQRYFIIVGTAFGGAWTLIVGVMALLGNPGALAAAAANDVWVVYPLDPAPGQPWVPLAWIVLGLTGTGVQ